MIAKFRNWVRVNKKAARNWLIVFVCLLIIGSTQLLAGDKPNPLDPDSAAPDGTKAFAELIRQTGATYSIGNTPSDGTAILLSDTLSQAETDSVEAWVRSGGRLIVADYASSLTYGTVGSSQSISPARLQAHCQAQFADNVGLIQPDGDRSYATFEADDADAACFPAGSDFFIVEHNVGRGEVISVGTPLIFTNKQLGKLDNSVLLVNLVQPRAGQQVVYLETRDVEGESGGKTLRDLIPPRVGESFWQLLLTALFLAMWRARRLGAPVLETQRVQIPASQLVVATANLYQTAEQSAAAAAILRTDTQQALAQMLGVSVDAPVSVLIDVLNERSGIDRRRLEAVLVELPVNDNDELITLAQQLEYLYMEVSRVR